MPDNKNTSLNWDDFRALGNPENAPDSLNEDSEKDNMKANHFVAQSRIRVHLEKKGRGGKPTSIIRGLEMTNDKMKEIEKALKTQCGVGGSQKNGEIILQGDQRDKIIAYLTKLGAADIKKAGS